MGRPKDSPVVDKLIDRFAEMKARR